MHIFYSNTEKFNSTKAGLRCWASYFFLPPFLLKAGGAIISSSYVPFFLILLFVLSVKFTFFLLGGGFGIYFTYSYSYPSITYFPLTGSYTHFGSLSGSSIGFALSYAFINFPSTPFNKLLLLLYCLLLSFRLLVFAFLCYCFGGGDTGLAFCYVLVAVALFFIF